MQRALRFTVLEFLYMKRQSEPEKPSVFPMELAELVGVPCEQLEFTMWFLLQKGLVQRTDHSNLAITAAGVEYLEQNDEGGITQGRLRASGA
jgi:hypothetical protein